MCIRDRGARIAAALPQLFEQAAVDPRIRGEALALEDFVRLGAGLEKLEASGALDGAEEGAVSYTHLSAGSSCESTRCAPCAGSWGG